MNFITIRRKSFILLISYLCSCIAVLCGIVICGEHRASEYERTINAGYTRAFYELSGDMAELSMSLQKAQYSTSPALLSSLCTNIYGKANAAQTSLAELPFSDYTLENASSFITRTGDFAFALSRKISGGDSLSREEQAALQALSDTAAILSQNLIDTQFELESGEIRISDIGFTDSENDNAAQLLGDRFQAIENEFPEIPVLVYDGPFSHHIDSTVPVLLENEANININEAIDIAARFMEVSPDELKNVYEIDGKIPLYSVNDTTGRKNINITKQGGKVFSMSIYGDVGEPVLNVEKAIESAKNFLAKQGFNNLQESYWTQYDNTLLVNFAAVSGEFICYPDLIKAEITLDTGDVIAFEAAGYISNHAVRSQANKKISEAEAAEVIPAALKILSCRLCIIPSSGKYELPCYEFTCENERGNHYLIYVNVETGEQEKIICLIESKNGTLAM